jgi:hypothetical protein
VNACSAASARRRAASVSPRSASARPATRLLLHDPGRLSGLLGQRDGLFGEGNGGAGVAESRVCQRGCGERLGHYADQALRA